MPILYTAPLASSTLDAAHTRRGYPPAQPSRQAFLGTIRPTMEAMCDLLCSIGH
jgi:hypothetical protein